MNNDDIRRMSESLISTSDFDEFLEYHTAQAIRDVRSSPSPDFQPRIILHLDKPKKEGYVDSYQDEETRQASICFLKSLPENKQDYLAKCGADAAKSGIRGVAAFFLSEAWMKKMNKKEMSDFDKAPKRVHDYEDKSEIIMVVGRTLDGRANMAVITIDRTPERNIIVCSKDVTKTRAEDGPQDNLLTSFWDGYIQVFAKE